MALNQREQTSLRSFWRSFCEIYVCCVYRKPGTNSHCLLTSGSAREIHFRFEILRSQQRSVPIRMQIGLVRYWVAPHSLYPEKLLCRWARKKRLASVFPMDGAAFVDSETRQCNLCARNTGNDGFLVILILKWCELVFKCTLFQWKIVWNGVWN